MRCLLGFVLFACFLPVRLYCQNADFNVSSTSICLNQSVTVTNASTGLTDFAWDFCQDGFLHPAQSSEMVLQTPASIPVGMSVVYQGGNWYGFVCGRENSPSNKISRFVFAGSLDSTPTALPDFSSTVNSALNGASEIKFVKHNGNWFGFVANYHSNNLIRLDFGASLDNDAPSVLNIGNPAGWNGFYGLDVLEHNGDFILAGVGNSSNSISLVNFSNTLFGAAPTSSSVSTITSATDPLINAPVKITFAQEAGNWFALFTSLAGQVVRLSYGTNLASAPAVGSVGAVPTASALALAKDGLNYFSFIQNSAGTIYRLNFGSTLTGTPVLDQLPSFGAGNTYGLCLAKQSTNWRAFYVEVFTGKVYRVNFIDDCKAEVNNNASTQPNPPPLNFLTSGSKVVQLTGVDSNLDIFSKEVTINVSSSSSPTINFSVTNICIASPSIFSANSNLPISTYAWDFGDSGNSNLASPNHQYTAVGTYQATLLVTADNGCENTLTKSISIYDVPNATFATPGGLICTNNEFTFSNQTVDTYNGALVYSWYADDSLVSQERDLKLVFETVGDHVIKLRASIPGCYAEASQTVANVQTGPTVSFDFEGPCAGTPTTFINNSTGSIDNFRWTFGNGDESQVLNPSVNYSQSGSYEVSLEATGTNGCLSLVKKALVIYKSPTPNFSVDLPPFSCTSSPTQFHDLTPSLDDSNIQTRAWTFGNSGTGSGKDPIHTYSTAGDYPVTLVVTTDKGCSATKMSTVTIAQSPVADFAADLVCLNKAVHFTSATNNIKSWQWKIDNSNYSVADPTHIFLTSGNRSVTLKLTGTNDCVASVTKTVYVPPVPLLDFEMTNPCVGQESVFESKIVSPDDAPNLITWQFENAGSLTGTTTRFAFDTPGAHPVGMTVQNQSGCQYQLVKNVTTYAAPIVSFGTSVDTGPAPLEVNFTNTTTGAVSYRWLTNGTESATTTNFKTTFSNVGDYVIDLVAMSDRGCMSSITKDIKVIVPRTELALSQFNLFEDPISGALRNQLMVTNASNYPIRSFDVILDLGNGSSVRETITQEIKVGETSTFLLSNSLVLVSSGYVCAEIVLPGDEKTDNNKLCTPLTDKSVLFTPSPNPATDVVNVEVIAPAGGTSMARIVNSMGQLTFTCQLELQKGLNRFELDIRSLQPGIYFLTFETGSERQIHRLVIN